jgi:YnbE-like lipoprotein
MSAWIRVASVLAACGVALIACTPKAEVEIKAPTEPIVINLNVKIEHEIRVKVDKDVEHLIDNSELF